jgi:outer membrane lipoprotein-sorting protein
MVSRRCLLLSVAALLPVSHLAAAPVAMSAQDQADIARIETYLNGLKTLKAHFTQAACRRAPRGWNGRAACAFSMIHRHRSC